MSALCLCGSGRNAADCCTPLHQGQPAPSPEALMRSRYSAFASENADYLLRSWHPDYRPETLDFPADTRWTSLTVLSSREQDDVGEVHFIARFQEAGEWFELEEASRFSKLNGHWFYEAGNADFRPLQPGRNDPCPCGSGRKWKKCCA